ncbi:hypothetical protein SD77_3386 [Bacillus badius]|uniref:Uncharacterized protein n=1 Tax=Bacillus badius TaxID=1455 RepID=A0ABR5AXP9_BACBA|nr:hypothetical protein SD78_0022 [Bacillus badius]KIL79520.1 hypothetical protein SD77_3386 [Bacillus badius]TDV99823.1 hypothetical protein B0G66_11920 [Bacillus badius]
MKETIRYIVDFLLISRKEIFLKKQKINRESFRSAASY